MIKVFFRFSESGTDYRREILGGATTFLTMAYIIFVQPAVLSAAGMDFGAVMVATCLSSIIAILIMGLYANYPIALAPGMGQNFFFSYTVVLTLGIPWPTALGIVFIAGCIFLGLSFFGVREKIINAIPQVLQKAIGAGIGLMITLIGLEWSGLVVDDPSLLVTLGDFTNSATLLSLCGFFITAILLIRNIPGAFLIGIISTTGIGYIFGLIPYYGMFSAPPSLMPTFLKLDIGHALAFDLLALVFTFLILDLFDTIGTLIGVAGEAGLLKNGKLPRARRALLADAMGTVVGSLAGTSTVTSYVESASGVASGARTGFANLITASLFAVALFCFPLVKMIGGGVQMQDGSVLYPTVAPVLILVGVYMLKSLRDLPWEDLTESIPAFITLIFIPFSFRITEGIALGFITYTVLKLFAGKASQIPLLMWVITAIFLLRYIFLGV